MIDFEDLTKNRMVDLQIFTTLIVVCATSTVVFGSNKDALIVVDVQNCFTTGGTLEVEDGEAIIPIINSMRERLESQFDLVVLSQDWHCSDHVSFASQHVGYSPLETTDLYYNDQGELCRNDNLTSWYTVDCGNKTTTELTQTLWPDHCIIDTEDAQFHQDLVIKEEDVIIQKGFHCYLDSYSVFYDNGHFGETNLTTVLKDNGISTIYIAGLATDYCVYYTAKDGKQLGYDTHVIYDATRGVANATTEAALADMLNLGIHLTSSEDINPKPVTDKPPSHAPYHSSNICLLLTSMIIVFNLI